MWKNSDHVEMISVKFYQRGLLLKEISSEKKREEHNVYLTLT